MGCAVRAVTRAVETGVPAAGISRVTTSVTATIGGGMQTFLAGLAPGYIGLYQVNLLVRNWLAQITRFRLAAWHPTPSS